MSKITLYICMINILNDFSSYPFNIDDFNWIENLNIIF